MTDIAYISGRLQKLGFRSDVLLRYREPHRFYHTEAHLLDVMSHLSDNGAVDDELFLAAVYHDAVYNPKADDNEARSAELFMQQASAAGFSKQSTDNVSRMIMDTKTHTPNSSKSALLINADLNILSQPFARQMEYEHQIFREFQFVNYNRYRTQRIEILQRLNENGRLDRLIEYVTQRKPLIGVFCGSFNPFHRGHYNVLQKAERIFDKVIIAFGKNPDKKDRTWPLPEIIKYHQLEEYTGLLTDFVQSLGHDVVVIRGLRNSTDFQYEQNQYRYIQELMPGIKIINIFCDKEFEHISSSGIRVLEKYNKHHIYLLD